MKLPKNPIRIFRGLLIGDTLSDSEYGRDTLAVRIGQHLVAVDETRSTSQEKIRKILGITALKRSSKLKRGSIYKVAVDHQQVDSEVDQPRQNHSLELRKEALHSGEDTIYESTWLLCISTPQIIKK